MTFTELLTESRRLVKATSTSYPTTEVTVSCNRALERVTGLIRDAEGRWQWDDSNDTDFPFATTSLVTTAGSEVQDYSLDISQYRIERVEVKDVGGNWQKLFPIDQSDIYNQSLTDFLKTPGMPMYYDKVGNSIFLYPKPLAASVTATSGLKVFYERGPSFFTTSDTTKTPGFNPLFHRLVALWSAYDYAFVNSLKVSDRLRAEITQMESQLQDYYSLRDKDEHIRLSTRHYSFK